MIGDLCNCDDWMGGKRNIRNIVECCLSAVCYKSHYKQAWAVMTRRLEISSYGWQFHPLLLWLTRGWQGCEQGTGQNCHNRTISPRPLSLLYSHITGWTELCHWEILYSCTASQEDNWCTCLCQREILYKRTTYYAHVAVQSRTQREIGRVPGGMRPPLGSLLFTCSTALHCASLTLLLGGVWVGVAEWLVLMLALGVPFLPYWDSRERVGI